MGEQTGIAWTDATFNPWWGCQRVSPGCEHCYAEAWAKRTGAAVWGPTAQRRFFGDKHWREPLRWNAAAEKAGRRRTRVFCASMADVFEDRDDLWRERARLFDLILDTPWLDWQLLTKRPENMVRLAWDAFSDSWPDNVWAMTTCEDQQRADERIPHLLKVPARVRGISYEPALSPVDFLFAYCAACNVTFYDGGNDRACPSCHGHYAVREPRAGVDWIIVGGESGAQARPFNLASARSVIAQCKAVGTACFVKQLGSDPFDEAYDPAVQLDPSIYLKDRKGGDMDEWPADLRVREFPALFLPATFALPSTGDHLIPGEEK